MDRYNKYVGKECEYWLSVGNPKTKVKINRVHIVAGKACGLVSENNVLYQPSDLRILL